MPSIALIRFLVFCIFFEALMTPPSDPFKWPHPNYKTLEPDYVHAVGQITLLYNLLEELFGFIFNLCCPGTREFALHFFSVLNNRNRVDLLTAIAESNEKDPRVKE